MTGVAVAKVGELEMLPNTGADVAAFSAVWVAG